MTKRSPKFLQKPTVSGPLKLVMGKQEFGLPEGSQVHWLNDGTVAWVQLPSGGIRSLSAVGEAEVPSYIADQVTEMYFNKNPAEAAET